MYKSLKTKRCLKLHVITIPGQSASLRLARCLHAITIPLRSIFDSRAVANCKRACDWLVAFTQKKATTKNAIAFDMLTIASSPFLSQLSSLTIG
jgi:hypothetical protein